MKYLILICLIASPCQAFGQVVNPTVIQRDTDIALHHTDVYYNPFAPPTDSDTRENLCNESDLIRDPNGVGSQWRDYDPVIRDTVAHRLDTLRYWHPCGDTTHVLGSFAIWQRLFQARDKPDGAHSDIIAGGGTNDTVTISKNEDVDFRASGTIKIEAGVHGMPGAFFHAYIEPKFDSVIFSDEFDDTAKFHNHWYVAKGNSDDYGTLSECSSDSNVYLDTDYLAHDGHALDIIMRENTPYCSCDQLGINYMDSCQGTIIDSPATIPLLRRNLFSTAILRSCPYPFSSTHNPLGTATYANAPYGKYEFRDKIPHALFHTNNWGSGGNVEYDLNETINGVMGAPHPGWGRAFTYGPFEGIFKVRGAPHYDTIFVSPTAGWGGHNLGTQIIINNVIYGIQTWNFKKDTAIAAQGTEQQGGFPASILADSTDSVAFYYQRYNWASSDTVTWHVTTDGGGKWDVLNAPYKISGGVSTFFSRDYQPIALTLRQGFDSVHGDTIIKTFDCRWDHTLNAILLNPYGDHTQDSLLTAGLHSNTEQFQYNMVEGGQYPMPQYVLGDRDTAMNDTTAFGTTPYRYHTFTMEWLPHEVRYLVDSVVVRRWPDRLVPPGNKFYDWASGYARGPVNIHPAEMDPDMGSDPFGVDSTLGGDGNHKLPYVERKYFEEHPHNPGFWDVTIGGHTYHAAHHLLDYVKIWDLPSDMIVPKFPQ